MFIERAQANDSITVESDNSITYDFVSYFGDGLTDSSDDTTHQTHNSAENTLEQDTTEEQVWAFEPACCG